MERSTHSENLMPQQEQNLYGVRLFLAGENSPEAVRGYIDQQEKTHLAEGLELQQRTTRVLEYDGRFVLGFGGKPMVEVNRQGYRKAKKQYLSGDAAAFALMKRREHDVTISECTDALMADGQVGDVIMATSPFLEELPSKDARRLGDWPEYRRSYVWLYRKKSASELECTDISIDQSDVESYKKLLTEFGADIPADALSYDIPGYLVQLKADTDEQRSLLVNQIINRYSEINQDSNARQSANAFEAVEFLDQNARHYLRLIVDVHESIARSLITGSLDDLVKISASRALSTLNCLDAAEVQLLKTLLRSESIGPSHEAAFATLIAAQRYGVWEGMSQLAGGENRVKLPRGYAADSIMYQALLLDQIYKDTNTAAELHKTMPGCAGGSSFLQQDEGSVKSSIFDGEHYSFDKEMYCVVCQSPPKEGESKKMCGPCGICKGCDAKLKK